VSTPAAPPESLRQAAAEGLEPVERLPAGGLPAKPRSLRHRLRLNIRGRSVTLRGLRRPPTGLLRWLLILGPGLIATSAGNDAGGITTYSAAGARFGYDLIWVMVLLTIGLAVVQELSARLGAATGRGLLDLIRERYGLGWGLFATGSVLAANVGLIVSEFVGLAAAGELFGLSRFVVVPLAAALLWYLVLFGSYGAVEKIFLVMTLVFFAYPVAAVMARPDWGAVARGAFIPTVHADQAYLLMVVGLLGTTITPYMQVFQQSSIVERGVARRHYGPERVDAYFGAFFSNVMSVAMIIATAATLHAAGQFELTSATDAARALEPAVGPAAKLLFAVGLVGASLLAAAVLPLATAYAVSEMLGAPHSVSLDFRRAPLFFGLFTAMLVVGAGLALLPGLPFIPLLLLVQVANGLLLPVTLLFMLRLSNDARLMGPLRNTRRFNVVAWAVFLVITGAVLVMLGSQVWGLVTGGG
jgi:NRAMP (natural resistance-associated macrophage protein)-like metal ion transporter